MNKRGRIRLYLLLVTAILLFMLIVQAQILTPSGENTSELLSVRSNLSSGSGGGGVRFLGQIAENLSEIIVSEEQNKQEQIFQSINLSNTSSRSIKYDSRIVEEFNKTNISKVKVIVRLADDSAIKVAGAKEEKRELLRQRDEWFKSKNEIFLSTLPKNHFNISSNITDGFVGMITKEGLDILLKDSRIKEIQMDGKVYGALDESVSWISVDDDVWNLGYTGDGIKVCVIDTGVNADHPDLSGKIIDEYCYCDGGCCPDNTDEDDDAEDDHGHGTHVTGIIASQDSTFKGVAYDADIYVVKVLDSNNEGDFSDVGKAIDKCRAWGVDIISMSLGDEQNHPGASACPSYVDTDINEAYNADIPLIAVSGNQYYLNGINYPGCATNVISVGATRKDSDSIAAYTNRGTNLDLLAPGHLIWSLNYQTSGVMLDSGTSMAVPHVSGAAALLLEFNNSLTPDDIEEVLEDTGTIIGSWPRINVKAAIDSLSQSSEPSGELSECTEPGYDQCIEYAFGDCDVSIAINRYTSVNDIKWGEVVDSSDPYVIGSYTIGWKDVDAQTMYYDNLVNETCSYGGCDSNDEIADSGTMVTVNAPGQAYHEMLLGYDDTASYACWTWFNDFYPNYENNPYIYVLNCFDDNDCSASEYCDKSGDWDDWDCVAKKSDGQSCTEDFQCSSGYCDDDEIGLSDDNWCFTPYNTYFDGQENTYCEISSGNGIADCDERQSGTDLDKCIGTSYYEEECSSTCNYQDITSVFECTDTGCSCTESLCDGLTTGSSITTCSSGQTYFADKCTSTAGGEDRTDTICRSSSFVAGCTADSECNDVEAGTNDCTSSCVYNPDNPPSVTLVSPSDNNINTSSSIIFSCSATDDINLANMTLYHNISGTWQFEETKTLSGTSDSETFTVGSIPDETSFIWNCLAYDNASQSDWGNANYTIKINLTQTAGNLSISSLQSLYSDNTLHVFEIVVSNTGGNAINNVTWSLDMGDSYIINSTQNISLEANEDILVFVEYNYSSEGSYTVTANASNSTISDLETLEVNIGDLLITSFDDIYVDGTNVLFEGIVKNNLEAENITDINWSLTTDDGEIINSTQPFNLTANESILIYIEYQYSAGGTYNPFLSATNGIYSASKSASVSTTSAPTISPALPDIEFDEDTYNDSLDLDDYASDAEDPDSALTWTYSGNTNVIVNISETTHVVNFTAVGNFTGSENIKFTVNDTSGLSNNDTILVTMNAVNDPPTFNSSNSVPNLKWPEDTINESIILTEHFYDIDEGNLNFTASNTENISIYIENITGKVNITPNTNWSGIAYAVFTTIDSEGLTATSNNITLNITPVNDAPTFTGIIPQWKWPEDTINNSLDLMQYFSDIDGDSLQYNFTFAENITISANNATGIITLTPNGNFTGVEYTLFTAIDAENLTISSNNVTLNVTPVNDAPIIESFTPTDLTPTVAIGNSLIFNHTSSDIDGDTLTYSWKVDLAEQSTGQGWTYTPTGNEVGIHNITLNVSDGTVNVSMQWNITVINESNIDVYDFSVLNQDSTVVIFGFSINNTGNNATSVNWSIDTGEEIIFADTLTTLQPNESVFVFAAYNYSATGDYSVVASATDGTYSDSESITIDIPDIEVNSLSVLNISGTVGIFEFVIENTLQTNLTNVSWVFDTKNSNVINSTYPVTLQPSEEIFVYVQYNFTETGTFNVNATAINGSLSDSRNLTVII